MEKLKLNPNELHIEKLNESHLPLLNTFSSAACKELDDFLKQNAWSEQKIGFSTTYLFFHNIELVGYITLLSDRLSLKLEHLNPLLSQFEEKTTDGYSSVPALKIGRMCVSDKYNSQIESAKFSGLGTIMFASILSHAESLADKIGCRVITTHAKKATNAYLWYQKVGFEYTHDSEKTNDILAKESHLAVPMFYDLHRIIKSIGNNINNRIK